ncbi:MAG: 23S rRNA (guanosine(2251)-2'-O)-methyltransferase RlmB [Bacteroidales bacterium]|jgi:23S rRNA (guanosine2251-2'-O)-methyltransferase|nr:23S rRNA (guanosine(2251)-2'-O)-methyltransferase RlmB [Bacteroidales bacterium]MDX9798098.1 23S rRNA (guanosine(2251)-2'-O)-methyltransferase RlmB [Bacteroidales bacterium]
MKESQIIYGVRPVVEALRSGKEIEKVLIQSSLQGNLLQEVKEEISKRKTVVQYVPIEKLNRMTKNNHQGVVAIMSLIEYFDFEEVVMQTIEKGSTPFLIMLDRVTDVRNLGAIARSAECAGVDAIIVPQYSSAQINEDAIKTSSGALLRLPICKVANLKTTINTAKQLGVSVFCATEKGSELYTQVSMKESLMIVMGSEDTGVSPDIIKICDNRIKIPIKANIESLNVSVAAGILMYEVVRQRDLINQ